MSPVVVLRDARVERFGIRWEFELRDPDEAPILLVVRSTRNGQTIVDVQQLGPIWNETELSAGTLDLLADRIREELVRVNLGAALSKSRAARRAA